MLSPVSDENEIVVHQRALVDVLERQDVPDLNSFIQPELVLKARREVVEPSGPLIIGVDPAGMGADRAAIVLARLIGEEKPLKVYIDVGGLGVGIYDRLVEQGFVEQGFDVASPVNFGGKPIEPATFDEAGRPAGGPANRRAELWLNLRRALEEGRYKLPTPTA